MVGEVGVLANDDLAAVQVFGLKVLPIGGEDEFCTGFRRRRAGLERRKSRRDRAIFSDLEVDVVGLKNPPTSDLLDVPDRRRLIVVALLPNASKNAKGNSSASNGCSASLDMASSISTAFKLHPHLLIGGQETGERDPIRMVADQSQ